MTSYVDDDYDPHSFRTAIKRQALGRNPSPKSGAHFDKLLSARTAMRAAKCGSFVYYLRLEGRVKIGTTRNLKVRMRDLPWDTVELLEVGDAYEEHERHLQFAHLRIQGEWFKAEKELLKFITARRLELQELQRDWFPELPPLPWGISTRIPNSKAIQERFIRRHLARTDC